MKYRIQPGHSFLDSDGTVKGGGEAIELSDDVAAANADKVEPITDQPAVPTSEAFGDQSTDQHPE